MFGYPEGEDQACSGFSTNIKWIIMRINRNKAEIQKKKKEMLLFYLPFFPLLPPPPPLQPTLVFLLFLKLLTPLIPQGLFTCLLLGLEYSSPYLFMASFPPPCSSCYNISLQWSTWTLLYEIRIIHSPLPLSLAQFYFLYNCHHENYIVYVFIYLLDQLSHQLKSLRGKVFFLLLLLFFMANSP